MGRETEERRDESFAMLNADGTRVTQKVHAFRVLDAFGPLTGNRWSEMCGIRRTSMCRVIKDLVNDGLVSDKDEVMDGPEGKKRRVTLYRVAKARQLELPLALLLG